MNERSLSRNTAWNVAGTVTHTAAQWAILIVLAKGGNPTMVGQVALGLAISVPLFFVFNLGLRQVLATDAKTEFPPRLYLRTRLATAALALALVVLASVLLSSGPGTVRVVLLVGLAKAFDAVSELCYGLFQRIERLDYVGRSLIVRGLLSVVAVAFGLRLTGRVEIAVGGWALVWGAMLLLHDMPLFLKHAAPAAPRKAAMTLVRLALPLGIAGMLVALVQNMPRYYLAHFHTEARVGLFAAAAYIPMSGRRLLEAVGQVASPRLARLWADGQGQRFRRLLARLIGLGAGCAVLGVAVVGFGGETILAWVYTAEYAAHADVFLWLMLSWGLRYPGAFLTSGLIAARRFKLVPWVFLPSLVAAVAGGAVLIPRHGLFGAAWADMIATLFQIALIAYFARSLFAERTAA